jgi:hypothetical protein
LKRQHVVVAAIVIAAALAGFFLRDQILALVHRPPEARAQAAPPDTTIVRPLTGTLHILVPTGLLGADYWVYVNDRLVSEPPHDLATTLAAKDLVRVPTGDGFEFWDGKGRVIATVGDRFTFLREDMKGEHVLFTDLSLPIAPGTYEVAVMARAMTDESYPFSLVQTKAQVVGGQTSDVMMTFPRNYNIGPVSAPPRAAIGCSTAAADELRDIQQRYSADRLARALQQLEAAFGYNPPQQPTAILDLPEAWGGAREYSAAQIDDMVSSLSMRYAMGLSDDYRTSCRPISGPAVDQLVTFAQDFDHRIDALREISRKLRQAASVPGAR